MRIFPKSGEGALRYIVTGALAIIAWVAKPIWDQAVNAFASSHGWDQILVKGWQAVGPSGYGQLVLSGLLMFAGATLALWLEFGIRSWREKARSRKQEAGLCTATFQFEKSADGGLSVDLQEGSENVARYAWYVNNGGTLRNEATLLFVYFEKNIKDPAIYAHAAPTDGKWREFYSADAFMFIEFERWPSGEVSVMAIEAKALGLDRRDEPNVWRSFGPLD